MAAPPTILICDDEPDLRELMRISLEPNYRFAEAADGDEAIEQVDRLRPDLVLLDVMMPHVDGWEMLRRIQEQYGAGAIPVVMFSGQVDEHAQNQAASGGAQAFVGKPFDLQQLIEQTKQVAPV